MLLVSGNPSPSGDLSWLQDKVKQPDFSAVFTSSTGPPHTCVAPFHELEKTALVHGTLFLSIFKLLQYMILLQQETLVPFVRKLSWEIHKSIRSARRAEPLCLHRLDSCTQWPWHLHPLSSTRAHDDLFISILAIPLRVTRLCVSPPLPSVLSCREWHRETTGHGPSDWANFEFW